MITKFIKYYIVMIDIKGHSILNIITILFVLFPLVMFSFPTESYGKIGDEKEILIASWNMWDFVDGFGSGRNTHEVLYSMSEIMNGSNYITVGKKYDIIFVQEIKNTSGTEFVGFDNLCTSYMNKIGYSCKHIQKIIGDGSNNEGYGVIHDKTMDVRIEYTGDVKNTPYIMQGKNSNQMVRPPLKATIIIDDGEYHIDVYNNHIIPSSNNKTKNELLTLQNAINYDATNLLNEKNIIVLGDLNAGCRYLPGGFASNPELFNKTNWKQVFSDTDYTNFAKKQCPYDKIILNTNVNYSYSNKNGIIGTFSDNTTFGKNHHVTHEGHAISDHKLVWAKLTYGAIESTDSLGNMKNNYSKFDDLSNCSNHTKVYAKGVGFVPNVQVDIFITEYPHNQNFIPHELHTINKGYFKYAKSSYFITDVRDEHNKTTVFTDINGNITNTLLWMQSTPDQKSGLYNIIVDVNRDGYFTNSIDVIDVFNTNGFVIEDNLCINSEIKNDIMNHDIPHNEIDYENKQCQRTSENRIDPYCIVTQWYSKIIQHLNSLIN